MKTVAAAREPPVVVPVIVVAVDVHVALVIPAVERGRNRMGRHPYHCPPKNFFSGLYRIRHL